MRFLIALFLFLTPALSIAQKNVLVIQKSNSEFSKEIKENNKEIEKIDDKYNNEESEEEEEDDTDNLED